MAPERRIERGHESDPSNSNVTWAGLEQGTQTALRNDERAWREKKHLLTSDRHGWLDSYSDDKERKAGELKPFLEY